MTSESVRVAVRVRPFNSREIERGAKSIIEMDGSSTKIVHPSDPKNVKTFNFDYSYWSHNGFKVDPDGQLDKDSPTSRYASQRCVFEDLGQDVLKNALEGYNCSLFAYGQTGSGKSYSMVGYETNKGIVPITCNELFKMIESNTTSSTKYAVSLSMLEIYNERVKDLLVKSNKNLEIRQSEKLGFYVQDLEKINVGSYKEIERKMNQGSANRTIAATQMNATSSRAHTVITIEFKQIISSDSGVNTKSSTINLIDLAGSERADSTGATGDRLKEGANINKSLSALGNVIAALADLSGGKKNVLVPYRDSVLTKMLKNALGGNSKTIMIAALSPADINYDETLSTLRYADRAKRIKNVAMVNENPLEKLIRELRDENERLKRMLNGELPNEIDIRNLTETEIQKIRQELEAELRADMRINSEMLELHDKSSWNGKVMEPETSNLSEGVLSKKKSMECPYFCNLNEDPQLSGVLLHFIENEVMYIGKCEEDEEYSINISGPGVQPRHAITTFDPVEKVVTINFCSKDGVVRVNGVKISGITTINDLDRILLGSNNLYVFHNPFLPSESSIAIDWEFAQLEIASADGYTSGERSALESQIIEILPMVNEINAISKELNSHRIFNVLIIPQVAQDVLYGEEAKPKVMVKMTSTINNNCWLWERSVFINRRYMIQDQYQAFLNGEDRELISENSDPFWEPPTDLLVGQAYVYLQNISHNLGMSHEVRLIDYKGHEEGILYVKIEPCNQVGEVVDEDDTDSIIDDPSDLLNKSLFIKVTINKLFLYKARFFHGSNVKFRFYREDKMYTTETVKDTLEPQFDFEVIIELSSVTRDHLQYFEDGWITFLVFGTQKDVSAIESKQNILYKVKEASVKAEVNRRHDETEFRVYKTIDRLQRKKIGEVKKACIEWASKPPEEQQFDPFYRAIASVVFNDGKKFKVVASMIGKTKVAMNKVANNKTKNGETKADSQKTNVTLSRKVGGKDFSEICSIM